jgi:hypothetical protein
MVNKHSPVHDFAANQIISIKEARKILGKDAEPLDDNQIRIIIANLQGLANLFIMNLGSNN